MLDSLRAFSRTFVAKVFFAVLIVSFGAWGISGVVTGIGSTTVARVGNEDISVKAFQRLYQQQINAVAQQFGTVPTDQQALALGIPGSVLGQLATDAAVNQMAIKLGVGVSEERLSRMLRENPNFGNTLGVFDPETFKRVLQSNGYTDSEFFDLLARAARREQLEQGLVADAAVPKASIDLISRYQGDQRTIEYFLIGPANIPPVPEATDADLEAYLKDNQADFRTLETRSADILVLSPETLAASQQPTDAEIAAEYENQKAGLTRPEKRAIRQAVLPDQASVDAFTTGKAAGKSFDQLVAETGVAVTDLGTVGQADVLDTTVASAAFGLAANDFTIISGVGGSMRVVAVGAIEGGGTPTLEEAKETLRTRLATAKARAGYLEVLDQVEELRAAFRPLTDIAARFTLEVATVKVSASGAELADVAGLPEEARAELATAIFAADPEAKLNPTVSLGSNLNIFFDVTGTDAAHDQTLAEARDAVLQAWTDAKTEETLAAEVETIKADVQSGQALADVGAARNLFALTSPPLTRTGTDSPPEIDQAVLTEVFGGGPDYFGAARNGNGEYVVFRVTDIAPGGEDAQTKSLVEQSGRASLYDDFVTAVRTDVGVRENGAVLNQILNLGGT